MIPRRSVELTDVNAGRDVTVDQSVSTTYQQIVGSLRARRRAPVTAAGLVEARSALAGWVLEQWQREAEARSLGDPEPMPVRWALAAPAVMDHPHLIAPRGLRFTGRSDQMPALAEEFRRLARRRLVITGGAGSGKTTLAVQLLLELLTGPPSDEPVPVLFSIVGWDPQAQPRLTDWLTDRLNRDYPGLRAFGVDTAGALFERGHLLPVLDGLDEVGEQRRGEIITAVNASLAPGTGLILTSRSIEFVTAVSTSDVLTAAAVIDAAPLRPDEAVSYLRHHLPPHRGQAWSNVLSRLEAGTAPALAAVTANPLGLWLVRTVYIEGRTDPRCLIDGTYPDRASIQAHLLDQLIPAAVRSRPPTADRDALRPRRRYDPDDVRRWLTYLAGQLSEPDPDQPRRDWQWWHLARQTFSSRWSARTAGLVFGLLSGLVFGLVIGLAGGPAGWRWLAAGMLPGLVYGLVYGLVAGLLIGLTAAVVLELFGLTASPQHADLRLRGRWIQLLRNLAVGLGAGGLMLGLVFGLMGGLAGGAAVGLAVGLGVFLSEFISSTSAAQRATSPSSSHRGAWTRVAVDCLYTGLVGVLVGGLGVGLGVAGPGVVRLEFALAAALGSGLVVRLAASAWLAFVLATLWLAVRRRLPLRVMAFLEDAYRLGLLRVVGSSYQFRHAELQDRLALPSPSRPTR